MRRLLFACLWLAGCVPGPVDRQLVQSLDREVLALQERNRVLQAQLVNCDEGGAPPAIYGQMVQVFSGTEVEVRRDGPRVVIMVPGGLLFGGGEIDIRQEAMMHMDLLSTALQLHPDLHVWIVGHTDDRPLSGALRRQYGTNFELSAVRASSVMHALHENFGVARERFTVAGRGPVEPISDNDTPEGRALNRRIVIVIGPPDKWR